MAPKPAKAKKAPGKRRVGILGVPVPGSDSEDDDYVAVVHKKGSPAAQPKRKPASKPAVAVAAKRASTGSKRQADQPLEDLPLAVRR